MRKLALTWLSILLIILNSVMVLGVVTTPAMYAGGVVRVSAYRGQATCNYEIKTPIADIGFLGKARKECVDKNPKNFVCQHNCFSKVTQMLKNTLGRRAETATRCQYADISTLPTNNPYKCVTEATSQCARLNPRLDWCKRECIRKLYVSCRQIKR